MKQNRMLNLIKTTAQKVGMITDCVVERGTSGIWDWEKWASGKSVCYGTSDSAMLSNYSGPHVSFFYGYKDAFYFPSNLFIDRPFAVYGCKVGRGFAMSGANLDISKEKIIVYTFATEKGKVECFFDIYAIGRWK